VVDRELRPFHIGRNGHREHQTSAPPHFWRIICPPHSWGGGSSPRSGEVPPLAAGMGQDRRGSYASRSSPLWEGVQHLTGPPHSCGSATPPSWAVGSQARR